MKQIKTSLARMLPWVAGLVMAVSMAGEDGGKTPDRVLALPPLYVDEVEKVRWTYSAEPQLQVLSQCSDEITRRWMRDYLRMYRLLDLVLPAELREQFTAPQRVLLYPQAKDSPAARRASEALARELSSLHSGEAGTRQNVAIRFTPNLLLFDQDCTVLLAQPEAASAEGRVELVQTVSSIGINSGHPNVTFNLDVVQRSASRNPGYQVTPEMLQAILERRRPLLPAWFSDGFLRFFRDVAFTRESVILNPLSWTDNASITKDYVERVHELVSLEEALADVPARSAADAEKCRRMAALFIRWCLADPAKDRATALWRFVSTTKPGGFNAVLFQDCFRLTPSEALEAIDEYFPAALADTIEFKLEARAVAQAVAQPSLATPAEIAEVKLGWQRLELNYITESEPALVPRYTEQLSRSISRNRAAKLPSPAFYAEAGLWEAAQHLDAAALEDLQKAARGNDNRPRVYNELARLLLEKMAQAGETYDTSQADGTGRRVDDLLARARAQLPPLLGTYLLECALWNRQQTVLTVPEIRVLNEGLALFPESFELFYKVAVLEVRSSQYALATETINIAKGVFTQPDQQRLLADLAAQISHKQ